MKASLLLVFLPALAFTQLPAQVTVLPAQVTVTVIQPPARSVFAENMGLLQHSYDQLNQTLMQQSALQQNQRQFDQLLLLERQEFEARQQPGAPLTYAAAHPTEAAWRVSQDVKDAIAACRALHDDCEKLDGMMKIIGGALKPDWKQLTMREYVECLYAVAKTAYFGEKARAMLVAAQQTPPEPKK
jgi:hypothetical protein